ncbi:unnamed protein product [Caenorhabditis sp. 36 PRJEB53466]|nr:unnamed protein product [Caenorhabditis sp. 36 PRJEB53466]
MRIHILYLIAFLNKLSCEGDANVFLEQPSTEPYYIREGDRGLTLPCAFNHQLLNRGKYEINWAHYNNGKLRIISKNEKLLVKKSSEFTLDSDLQTGKYNLIITTVDTKNVEGTYYCNAISTDASDVQHSTFANVIVLVPPGNPVININPSENVIEGDLITSKCVSIGGSPPPSFQWTLPNKTLASSTSFSTYSRDGATESLLHFRVIADDNGKEIQCNVTNKALSEVERKGVKSATLNVLYKPIVSVSPSENVTHLSVEEGTYVNLTCEGVSNPPIHSYEWKHLPTGERYQGKIWSVQMNVSVYGGFECKAINEVGETTALLNVVVQNTPRVTVPVSVSPHEKEDVSVKCEVLAIPKAVDIKWFGPNNFRQNGSELILKSISTSQTGNYTCMATNFLTVYGQSGSQQRVGAGTTLINVKRKPGTAHITGNIEVDVGEMIELNCHAEDSGNPKAFYSWSSPSSSGIYGLEGHNNQIFMLKNAQLADNGMYYCKLYNNIGEGKIASVNITVIEKAKISSPLTTEHIFTTNEQNKMLQWEIDKNIFLTTRTINEVHRHSKQELDGTINSKCYFNLSGLTPLTTYFGRIQAKNDRGASDFSPALVFSTEDVSEDLHMMPPSRLVYNKNAQTLNVEPQKPVDACTLLYVRTNEKWRILDCYSDSSEILNIAAGKEYKARFCSISNHLKCSPLSLTITSGSKSIWKIEVLSFIFFLFIFLSSCIFLFVCCKTRTTKKSSNLSPIILSLTSDPTEKKVDVGSLTSNELDVNYETKLSLKMHRDIQMPNDIEEIRNIEQSDCYYQEKSHTLKNSILCTFSKRNSVEDIEGDSTFEKPRITQDYQSLSGPSFRPVKPEAQQEDRIQNQGHCTGNMSSQKKCCVPNDLRPILEALAREVLRNQPSDVAYFGHIFFDQFLKHRDENKDILNDQAAYEVFRADVQRKISLLMAQDRSSSPLDSAATKIQAVFKGHLVRSNPEKYGMSIRTSSSEKLDASNNKKDQKRHSVGGYSIEKDTPEDRAATKIQSEIRGFLTRKHVEKIKKEDTNAATKIQAHIRGFLTRKHLDEQGLSPSRSHSSLHSNQSDDH